MQVIAALTAVAFLQLATTAADPKDPSTMNVPAAPARSMVIIGASYAADWGQPSLPGYIVTNRAVGGQETSDMRAKFVPDVIVSQPHAVLIWGHYNDVVRASPEQMAQAKQRARQNYEAMIDQARSAGIQVILTTEITMPIGDTWKDQVMALIGRIRGKEDYRSRVNRDVKEINQWLRTHASKNQLTLLDFELALDSGEGARKPDYAKPDGSHVNGAGYAVLTRFAAEVLQKQSPSKLRTENK